MAELNTTASARAAFHIDAVAVARYEEVMEHEKARHMAGALDAEMTAMAFDAFVRNRLMEKSSLYKRLLDGKKPLVMPPPTSFSYPWYEAIESGEAQDVMAPHQDGGVFLRINQHSWRVLKKHDDRRFTITCQNWDDLGFTWSLYESEIPAEEAGAWLCSHHDPALRRLLTESQLRAEAEHQARQWLNRLAVAIEGEQAPDVSLLSMAPAHRKFAQRAEEQARAQAREALEQRRKAGLPQRPSEDEYRAEVERQITVLLGDDWLVRDGKLFHRSWRLQRLTQETLCDAHYLDV